MLLKFECEDEYSLIVELVPSLFHVRLPLSHGKAVHLLCVHHSPDPLKSPKKIVNPVDHPTAVSGLLRSNAISDLLLSSLESLHKLVVQLRSIIS